MSVASTMSITNVLNSRNSSLDKFWRILQSSSLRILRKKIKINIVQKVLEYDCRKKKKKMFSLFFISLRTESLLICDDFRELHDHYKEEPYHSLTSRENCLSFLYARNHGLLQLLVLRIFRDLTANSGKQKESLINMFYSKHITIEAWKYLFALHTGIKRFPKIQKLQLRNYKKKLNITRIKSVDN